MRTTKFLFLLALTVFAANLKAQDVAVVEAPSRSVGDRWEWAVEERSSIWCTSNIPKGSKRVETITEITDDGYLSEITAPKTQTKTTVKYFKNMSYKAMLNGQEIRSNPINFPMRPGNTWETTLSSSSGIVTTLKCQQDPPDRLKIGNDELDVIPITCIGMWNNTKSGTSDKATYKYWYSPKVATYVKQTTFTYHRGGTCVDTEYILDNYQVAGK